MKNKFKLFLITNATCASFLSIITTSCSSYNFVNEKEVIFKDNIIRKQEKITLNSFINTIFNNNQQYIREFKDKQTIDNEQRMFLTKIANDFNWKLRQYQNQPTTENLNEIFNSKQWHDFNEFLKEKWYWYFTNLHQFSYQYLNVNDSLNQIIEKTNSKWQHSQEFLDNKKKIEHNFSGFEKFSKLTKEADSIEIMNDHHSSEIGSFYIRLNDYFFTSLSFKLIKDKNDQVTDIKIISIPNEIWTTSANKKIFLKPFQEIRHNIMYHTSSNIYSQQTIEIAITSSMENFEILTKSNGYWLNYLMVEFRNL
ncbi:aromatic motif membrane protein [Mesomycoplasma lagogenitalium]|uniref:Lipoprotein n=1 Tax=Mesomycoplasma lagogenitalium TaxID=171286 RepID=A0ABY8LUN5_9BACT|nr:aromatic motif membrane protein [Mesomycoplasma lagogenitalium]WGI36951.1 hypothetical protein QEG99_01555 [Mesomycoplasma lagogenitalium]